MRKPHATLLLLVVLLNVSSVGCGSSTNSRVAIETVKFAEKQFVKLPLLQTAFRSMNQQLKQAVSKDLLTTELDRQIFADAYKSAILAHSKVGSDFTTIKEVVLQRLIGNKQKYKGFANGFNLEQIAKEITVFVQKDASIRGKTRSLALNLSLKKEHSLPSLKSSTLKSLKQEARKERVRGTSKN